MNFTAQLKEEKLLACAPSMPVCNCAGCGGLLVSERTRRRWPVDARGLGDVFVRVKDRPLCRPCFGDGGTAALIHTTETVPCPEPTTT